MDVHLGFRNPFRNFSRASQTLFTSRHKEQL